MRFFLSWMDRGGLGRLLCWGAWRTMEEGGRERKEERGAVARGKEGREEGRKEEGRTHRFWWMTKMEKNSERWSSVVPRCRKNFTCGVEWFGGCEWVGG